MSCGLSSRNDGKKKIIKERKLCVSGSREWEFLCEVRASEKWPKNVLNAKPKLIGDFVAYTTVHRRYR